jgi:hypothetical protein
LDEQPLSQQYQPIKRRVLTNSIQTQTPPLQLNSHDHLAQQQLKALTDEALSKNEKIQAILRELNDCQVRLSNKGIKDGRVRVLTWTRIIYSKKFSFTLIKKS